MRYNLDIEYFKDIDSSVKAFWLGFICADGSIKSNRGKPYLKITQSNDILLNQFKNDISFGGNVKMITEQKGRYSDKPFYELTIYGEYFSQNILNAGKARYKKDQLRIPYSIKDEYIADFIRGYFEGDGSLYFANHNKNWYFSFSGYKELLEDIQKHIGIGALKKDKTIYSLKAGGNNIVERFVNMLYYNDNVYGIKHLKYRSG